MYSLDFTKEYNSWDIDPLKLFDAKTLKQESNPKMKLTLHLQNSAKGIDYLILWLDCDREGENICFEVIENCLQYMKHPAQGGKMNNVLRAKFSAITKEDVHRAMKNLGKPNENESRGIC